MKESKYPIPKIGDQLYLPTMMSISHGWDDMVGGIATVASIRTETYGVFVSFKDIDRGGFNLDYLMANQKKWSKEYAGKTAAMDPDFTYYGDE